MKKVIKKKSVSLLVFVVVFLAFAWGVATYFELLPKDKQDTITSALPDNTFGWKFPVTKFPEVGPISGTIAYSDIRDPGGIPQGLPVRLKIPTIGVDSAIEDALITPDGRMDVPAGSVNVAWFALGPHPGEKGSAVIGGHFGIKNGVPFVFYNLDKLKVGEKIYVEDDKGDTLAFVVRSTKSFDRNADATTVFSSADGLAHLNLITCEGIWNQTNGNYPQRLVVFADAVQGEGTAPQSSVFNRSLGIGSSGADVVTLQSTLESKGFLKMPFGVAKGYFGNITKTALAKYQTSIGFSSVGVLGPMTRAKLNSELPGSPDLPDTSGVIASAKNAITSQQTFFKSVKSLFATPTDGLITSVLLLSIFFIFFKIIRR